MLKGSYVFLIGEQEVELGQGACTFDLRNTAHGYTRVSAEPARMLVLATPGGVQKAFFDESGDHAARPWCLAWRRCRR